MIRIYAGIDPTAMTDEHLLMEHRQIKLITDLFSQYNRKRNPPPLPQTFLFGPGHAAFFLNKGYFTHARYQAIFLECKKRGYFTTNYNRNWLIYFLQPPNIHYYQKYQPTKETIYQSATNIINRLVESPKNTFHYYKKEITKDQALALITTHYVTTRLMSSLPK